MTLCRKCGVRMDEVLVSDSHPGCMPVETATSEQIKAISPLIQQIIGPDV